MSLNEVCNSCVSMSTFSIKLLLKFHRFSFDGVVLEEIEDTFSIVNIELF